jgi:hypothetical protein
MHRKQSAANILHSGCMLMDMKATRKADPTPHEKFTKALASVLSASPKQIQESRAQAKAEKPSPHTRYTYVPEEAES